jgi:Uma2 family endonuclease
LVFAWRDERPAAEPMRVREFIAWAQSQDRGRYELVGGEVVAMAPERAEHVRAKRYIANALDAAIARAGMRCEAFVDGLAVAIDDHTSYRPDALAALLEGRERRARRISYQFETLDQEDKNRSFD